MTKLKLRLLVSIATVGVMVVLSLNAATPVGSLLGTIIPAIIGITLTRVLDDIID